MDDLVTRLRQPASIGTPMKNRMAEAAAEIERLRAALKPFTEADWYAYGNGRFQGIVSGDALDAAKSLSR